MLACGRYSDAALIFRQLLNTQAPDDANPPPTRILALDGLGRSLHALEQWDEAEQVLGEALSLLEKLFGPEHPHVAGGLQNLARIRASRGQPREAGFMGLRALDILRKALGDAHPRVADALLNLSSSYYECGDYARAEAHLRQAQEIWEATLGRDSMQVSTCLNNLGRLHEQRGDPVQGAILHSQAVDIRRRLLGDHPETAFSLGNWGAALAEAKQWDKARSALEEAIACYERLGLGDSAATGACRHNLELCRQALEHPSTPA